MQYHAKLLSLCPRGSSTAQGSNLSILQFMFGTISLINWLNWLVYFFSIQASGPWVAYNTVRGDHDSAYNTSIHMENLLYTYRYTVHLFFDNIVTSLDTYMLLKEIFTQAYQQICEGYLVKIKFYSKWNRKYALIYSDVHRLLWYQQPR